MVRTRDKDCQQPDRLQIGEMIELSLGREGGRGCCRAQVSEIGADYIVVDDVICRSDQVEVEPGLELVVTFARDDAAYSFSSRVISAPGGSRGGFTIEQPDRIERIQRRRFFRIETDVPVSIAPLGLSDEAETRLAHAEWLPVHCLDISANGLAAVVSGLRLQAGDYLLMRIEIEKEKKPFAFPGRVLRAERSGMSGFKYGIEFFTAREAEAYTPPDLFRRLPQEFLEFGERERQALINQLLSRQVAMRQRGML